MAFLIFPLLGLCFPVLVQLFLVFFFYSLFFHLSTLVLFLGTHSLYQFCLIHHLIHLLSTGNGQKFDTLLLQLFKYNLLYYINCFSVFLFIYSSDSFLSPSIFSPDGNITLRGMEELEEGKEKSSSSISSVQVTTTKR